LSPNGAKRWDFTASNEVITSPAVASNGEVYFGTTNNLFYAVSSDGSFKWSYQTETGPHLSPILADTNGLIYLAAGTKSLTLRANQTASKNSWSMFRGDVRHSGILRNKSPPPAADDVTASQGEHGIRLSWKSVPGASSYEVWRHTNERHKRLSRAYRCQRCGHNTISRCNGAHWLNELLLDQSEKWRYSKSVQPFDARSKPCRAAG